MAEFFLLQFRGNFPQKIQLEFPQNVDELLDSKWGKNKIVFYSSVTKNTAVYFPEVGTRNFFFESAIAIPQPKGSTSPIAIPQLLKEKLVRNRNSAIPQSQFFLISATSSPQL